jgi:hypothetical protein
MFVLTLGYSRKAVHLLTFQSSTRIWAELHEQAFRRLGGGPRTVVLDNLGGGVLKPDIYDPALNPLYRDLLAHYGAVALPSRVRASASRAWQTPKLPRPMGAELGRHPAERVEKGTIKVVGAVCPQRASQRVCGSLKFK